MGKWGDRGGKGRGGFLMILLGFMRVSVKGGVFCEKMRGFLEKLGFS